MRKYPLTLHVYPRITLDRVIKGVEDLLKYYSQPRATRFNAGSCPLCDFFDCPTCLWEMFHHMGCEEFANKTFGADVSHMKKDEKWRALRREELKCWLEELKRPGVKVIEDA